MLIHASFDKFSKERIWPGEPFSGKRKRIVNAKALVQITGIGIGVGYHSQQLPLLRVARCRQPLHNKCHSPSGARSWLCKSYKKRLMRQDFSLAEGSRIIEFSLPARLRMRWRNPRSFWFSTRFRWDRRARNNFHERPARSPYCTSGIGADGFHPPYT